MRRVISASLSLLYICGLAVWLSGCGAPEEKPAESVTFVMNTVVTQTVYGENGEAAAQAVNEALQAYENRLSMFREGSDIYRINENAGKGLTTVEPETSALIARAVELSQSEEDGAFAVTIAPLTQAWGVTTDNPRVVPPAEAARLARLVDDGGVFVQGNNVSLAKPGMGLDLGGIAKGAACDVVAGIYGENGIDSALISIGGNVYARGVKPDGSHWRVGFIDPTDETGQRYLASFLLTDSTVAVSGGYERFFEVDGQRYIHILDPRTGLPAESDIVSMGVVSPDGAYADFMSTTLFVLGRDEAVRRMMGGVTAIVLDDQKNLFVSVELRDSFKTDPSAFEGYSLIYVSDKGLENEDGSVRASA